MIFIFLIFCSVLEIVGIGAIPLMVSAYLDNNTINALQNNTLLIYFEDYLNEDKILFFLGFVIILVFFIKILFWDLLHILKVKFLKI